MSASPFSTLPRNHCGKVLKFPLRELLQLSVVPLTTIPLRYEPAASGSKFKIPLISR
jgi:hypothetical protein